MQEDTLIDTARGMLEQRKPWNHIAHVIYYSDPKYTDIIQKHPCNDVDLMHYAAEHGYLKAMMFLHGRGAPWDEFTCDVAARRGMFVCLKYAVENGCPWKRKSVCYQSAINGHLNCLMYACAHGGECDKDTTAVAALNKTTDCLKFLHDHGCEWDERVCIHAAWSGNLENLKFAHEHGCPWNERVVEQAMMRRCYDCVRYAIVNGCPVSDKAEFYVDNQTPKDIKDLIQCRVLLKKLTIDS